MWGVFIIFLPGGFLLFEAIILCDTGRYFLLSVLKRFLIIIQRHARAVFKLGAEIFVVVIADHLADYLRFIPLFQEFHCLLHSHLCKVLYVGNSFFFLEEHAEVCLAHMYLIRQFIQRNALRIVAVNIAFHLPDGTAGPVVLAALRLVHNPVDLLFRPRCDLFPPPSFPSARRSQYSGNGFPSAPPHSG